MSIWNPVSEYQPWLELARNSAENDPECFNGLIPAKKISNMDVFAVWKRVHVESPGTADIFNK
jgi:hypothetical protein